MMSFGLFNQTVQLGMTVVTRVNPLHKEATHSLFTVFRSTHSSLEYTLAWTRPNSGFAQFNTRQQSAVVFHISTCEPGCLSGQASSPPSRLSYAVITHKRLPLMRVNGYEDRRQSHTYTQMHTKTSMHTHTHRNTHMHTHTHSHTQ